MKRIATTLGALAILGAGTTIDIIPVEVAVAKPFYQAYTEEVSQEYHDLLANGPVPAISEAERQRILLLPIGVKTYYKQFVNPDGSLDTREIRPQDFTALQTADGFEKNQTIVENQSLLDVVIPDAQAAITFDSSTATGANHCSACTSLVYAHTVTGSNTYALTGAYRNSDVDGVSGITFNGVSMARESFNNAVAGVGSIYVYDLVAPTTGNVALTMSSGYYSSLTATYAGARQTSQPDASNTNSNAGVSEDVTGTVTVATNNSWVFLYEAQAGTSVTAGSGATLRTNETSDFSAIGDSNGPLSAGSQTIHLTNSANAGGRNWLSITLAIAPAPNDSPGKLIRSGGTTIRGKNVQQY